VMMKRKV